MAKTSLQDYEFLQCEDGIYFGRALKNGSVSKDARKIYFAPLFSSIFLVNFCVYSKNVADMVYLEITAMLK